MAKRLTRRWRAALATGLSLTALILAVRVAVHQLPWFAPWLANALRSLIGAEAVTWLEQEAADLEDKGNQLLRSRWKPRSLEQLQPRLDQVRGGASRPSPTPQSEPELITPLFHPRDVGGMDPRVAATADGVWRGIVDPLRPEAAPLLFATLLHPDKRRPWSEVFVVAADLPRLQLHAVAGTREPEATTSEGRTYVRRGLIPAEHQARLLAAFNGGFMTRHGRHGMRVDGVTLVGPQPRLCTIVGLRDTVSVGSWRLLREVAERAEQEGQLLFWRQAAPCMFERGVLNPILRDENVRNWGATIDGNVVIRRSAVGLNGARDVLFVAVSNDTTATALAEAMHHAGAMDVAQLDVNWSYPKFLIFSRHASGQFRAASLFDGFVFHEDEYVRRSAARDFFYLIRREPPAR